MKVKMYVIYDTKAQIYNKPFFLHNDSIATRSFSDLANDPNTDVFKHPEDFILFYVGTYDDDTATFETVPPKSMCRAHELKLQVPPNALISSNQE